MPQEVNRREMLLESSAFFALQRGFAFDGGVDLQLWPSASAPIMPDIRQERRRIIREIEFFRRRIIPLAAEAYSSKPSEVDEWKRKADELQHSVERNLPALRESSASSSYRVVGNPPRCVWNTVGYSVYDTARYCCSPPWLCALLATGKDWVRPLKQWFRALPFDLRLTNAACTLLPPIAELDPQFALRLLDLNRIEQCVMEDDVEIRNYNGDAMNQAQRLKWVRSAAFRSFTRNSRWFTSNCFAYNRFEDIEMLMVDAYPARFATDPDCVFEILRQKAATLERISH